MIKGDINNVINWIRINDIQSWQMSATKNGNAENSILFKSNPERPIEQEFTRMIERFAATENTMVYLQGRTGQEKVGMFYETWSNAAENGDRMPSSLVGSVGTVPDQSSIQLMIDNAVQKERMNWMLHDLERREKDLRAEEREMKKRQEGAIEMLLDKAGGLINAWMQKKHGTQVAVAGVPEDQAALQPEAQQAEGEAEDDFTDEETDRIQVLIEKYKAFDPDYLVILEKLVGFATSGQDITVVPGLVTMDYPKIKQLILDNM